MRSYLVVLAMLCGCTYDLALYPRGGGEIARGTLYPGPTKMEVTLKGDLYTGKPVRGQTMGLAIGNTYGAKPTYGSSVAVGSSNAFSVLMLSGNKTLRCEFSGQPSGGNGVCVDGNNITYDLQIEPQK